MLTTVYEYGVDTITMFAQIRELIIDAELPIFYFLFYS